MARKSVPILIAKIMGKFWDIVPVSKLPPTEDGRTTYGECDHPSAPGKQIRYLKRLKGEKKLEILIHEMNHAAGWHIDEEFIAQFAEDCARTLWRLGYRNTEEHDG